jgi:hypothetical protein
LYRKVEKDIRKEIFGAKKRHFHELLENSRDATSYWRALNMFAGRHKSEQIPTLTSHGGQEFTTGEEKAEALKQPFCTVFTANDTSPSQEHNEPLENSSVLNLSVKYLLKKISKLSNHKAVGIDEIPAIVIKRCALVIAPCLVEIANRCLTEGVFPTIWKTALVVPIPKRGRSTNPADYRPISLLPLVSKLVESVINVNLQTYISPRLSKSQFGFRTFRYTLDAILLLQHHI